MAGTAPLYRVPVVIFAVIVGGLYVYAKSGGTLFPSRTQVTPASNSTSDDAALPVIEFYDTNAGSPQASFDSEPPQPWKIQPEQSQRPVLLPGSKAPSALFEEPSPPPPPKPRAVLSGSKSRPVLEPTDIAPPVANAAPANQPASPPRPAMLRGSKSMMIVDPPEFPPQPVQPAPQRVVLPGSKSATVVDPSSFTPTNSAPQQGLQQQSAPLQRPAQPRNNNAHPRYQGVDR
ncbi:hypothetical protein [Anatilimnocola floriformis]|uniref:hypothetical protein n=1 Tax=Anatilimnocola floriformis TaxID=2948575 RepID=UPI0020C2165B|nr:hypothetical protein [Anatilimnocola floriformis]